jgi:hypothetical protein
MLEGKGRLSRRKDGKYFLYLPKNVVLDSAFPFKLVSSVAVRVVADPKEGKLLVLPEIQKGRKKRQNSS